MGLGGFLAAKSELDHYLSEKKREEREVIECPDEEEEECFQVLSEFGITREVFIPFIFYLSLKESSPTISHDSLLILQFYFPFIVFPQPPIPVA
jgi:VIT family